MAVAVAVAGTRAGMWICVGLLLASSVLVASCSSSSEAGGNASVSSCTASQLSATGGRQGGGFQTAHGDIELRSVAPPDCFLNEVPTKITWFEQMAQPSTCTTSRARLPAVTRCSRRAGWRT